MGDKRERDWVQWAWASSEYDSAFVDMTMEQVVWTLQRNPFSFFLSLYSHTHTHKHTHHTTNLMETERMKKKKFFVKKGPIFPAQACVV